MAKNTECSKCGSEVSFSRGATRAECYACGTPVTRSTGGGHVNPAGPGCQLKLTVLLLAVGAMVGGVVLFLSLTPMDEAFSSVQSAIGPPSFQFGGPGTGRGYFDDPECIATDGREEVFVGERTTGRIQVFDMQGGFLRQWNYASSDEFNLRAAASDHMGRLYLIYDGELHIHCSETGEHLANLRHPDGWGFIDVDVFPDGHVVAAWYKNRDDILLFSPDGELVTHVREAISGVTGRSELSTSVAAGNLDELFLFGSFNSVVVKYDRTGVFLDRFGGDDLFTMPGDIGVDPAGRLWIRDFGNLLLFSTSGQHLLTVNPPVSVTAFVITDDFVLYGITSDDTVLVLDLAEYR